MKIELESSNTSMIKINFMELGEDWQSYLKQTKLR